jgi:hypothetical protein
MSVTPARYAGAPPRLGADTDGLRFGPEMGTS